MEARGAKAPTAVFGEEGADIPRIQTLQNNLEV
jgi:hypothetical protein